MDENRLRENDRPLSAKRNVLEASISGIVDATGRGRMRLPKRDAGTG